MRTFKIIDYFANLFYGKIYKKKFNIGDRVRYKPTKAFWQNLTIIKYDFCYNGKWWIVAEDTDDPSYRKIPVEEHSLELVCVEHPYDPTQMGDTDEDI